MNNLKNKCHSGNLLAGILFIIMLFTGTAFGQSFVYKKVFNDTTAAQNIRIAENLAAIAAIEIAGIQRSDSGTVFATPYDLDTLATGVYADINTYKVAIALNTDKISYTDAATVGLNTTHRSSDGTDHSKVNANETAAGLNTTHRSSDGSDHSNVVTNTLKVTNATHTGDVAGDAALTIGVDRVDEEYINWGTSTSQVSAVDMPIADAGSIITGEDVEAALQENRTAINAIDLTVKMDKSAFPDSFAVHADTLEYFDAVKFVGSGFSMEYDFTNGYWKFTGGGVNFLTVTDQGSYADFNFTGQLSISDDLTVGDTLFIGGEDVFMYRGSGNSLYFGTTTIYPYTSRVWTSGSAAIPPYSFNSNSNMGMYRVGADQLGFSTGGVNAFTIDASQVGTFTQFPITPSAAPTTDYQVINLKYFNDNVGSGGDSTWIAAETDTLIVNDKATLPGAIFDTDQMALSNHINSFGYSPYGRTHTAGEAIGQYKPCYLKGGKIYQLVADSAATSTDYWMGITLEAIAEDDAGQITDKGVVYGFSGLTDGGLLFFSATHCGITDTVPSGSGHQFIPIGKAISPSAAEIEVEYFAEVK